MAHELWAWQANISAEATYVDARPGKFPAGPGV